MKTNAFPAIVAPQLFEEVQKKLNEARRAPSNEILLQKLNEVLQDKGKLSANTIREAYQAGKLPSKSIYFQRFGSLHQTYNLLGFKGNIAHFKGQQQRKATEKLRDALIDRIVELFPRHVQVLPVVKWNMRRILLVDMQLKVTVHLCSRFKRTITRRWLLNRVEIGLSEAVLLCTLNDSNSEIEGYFVLRGISEKQLRMIPEGDRVLRDALKLESVAELYGGLCLRFREELGIS